MNESYIIAAKRTAVGRFGESLKDVSVRQLGAAVIKEVLADSKLSPEDVEEVILGHVLQAGNILAARNAAIDAGFPYSVSASVVNQACASGMLAVQQADRLLRTGDADLVIAGGVESMSSVPYLSRTTRWGSKYGSVQLEDELANGLTCTLSGLRMGETAENIANRYAISREEQDAFALHSQQKAKAAIDAGRFKAEIVPLELPARKGETRIFDTDEHPRETSQEALAKLKTVFANPGTVTPGNASGLNDGASALLLASAQAVKQHQLKPLARIISSATSGVDPTVMGLGPIEASARALRKANLTLDDIDLFEINEAFAAQVLGVLREMPVPPEKLNVNGGAIALGHAIGSSGSRILVTLIHEMQRRGVKRGLATLCIGAGMGSATIVEMIS